MTLSLYVPGVLSAVAVAMLAAAVGRITPAGISEVVLAILAGILIATVIRLPEGLRPGVGLASQHFLRLGVVLLGARLSIEMIFSFGGLALMLIVAAMTVAFLAIFFAARALNVPPRLAILIGVGTAVCGNSAIAATAPVIRAEQREVTLAIGTITLFGTLAVLAFPILGALLGLTQPVFGVWSGLAVNDTSQVVATSAAYGSTALGVAAVVKLVRNTLMAPLVLIISWWWARTSGTRARGSVPAVPLFVYGFVAMAVLRSAGVIGPELAGVMATLSALFILVALAAVGLSTSLRELRSGVRALAVGMVGAGLLAAASLGLVMALGVSPDLSV